MFLVSPFSLFWQSYQANVSCKKKVHDLVFFGHPGFGFQNLYYSFIACAPKYSKKSKKEFVLDLEFKQEDYQVI